MSPLMKLLHMLLPCLQTPADPDQAYLDEAVDIAELERRMRQLQARP
jgi:hypothetical protein